MSERLRRFGPGSYVTRDGKIEIMYQDARPLGQGWRGWWNIYDMTDPENSAWGDRYRTLGDARADIPHLRAEQQRNDALAALTTRTPGELRRCEICSGPHLACECCRTP